MESTGYKEEYLPDLLPLYYRRIFPIDKFYNWLCYGDPKKFQYREISFTLLGDVYLRHQSFQTQEDFHESLCKRIPVKMDIGAVYRDIPNVFATTAIPVERELIFDIDMNDYDIIRTCCTGTKVCSKCWKFMIIACKVIDVTLREDYDFHHLLWVFSGRRGIHCWVADERARKLDDNARSAIAEYINMQYTDTGLVRQLYNIHPSFQRALTIIDKYFVKAIVIEQDILGTEDGMDQFLSCIHPDIRPIFKPAILKVNTSEERWRTFVDTFEKMSRERRIPRSCKYLIEEIKFYYAYPRLDLNVTRGMNHLLKSPFCVHPKSGKVSVPFSPRLADNFNPHDVPTIDTLVDEINAYDARTQEQEKYLIEADDVKEQAPLVKIKDYKKTSLLKSVNVFSEFLRNIDKAQKQSSMSEEF